MRIIDFSDIDSLPERDRLDAISLIGDGLEARQNRPFGVAVGDRLFHIGPDSGGNMRVSFAGLLQIELGSIDQSLIDLPADARIWDDAMVEFLAWNNERQADEDPDPLTRAGDELRQILMLRGDHSPANVVKTMIGRYGFATDVREANGHAIGYRSFAQLHDCHRAQKFGMPVKDESSELLDWCHRKPEDAIVDSLLQDFERQMEASGYSHRTETANYYLALLCLERARIRSLGAPDPAEADIAQRHLVMARR